MKRYNVLQCISNNQGRKIYIVVEKDTEHHRIMASIPERDFNGNVADFYRLKMHTSRFMAQIYEVFLNKGNIIIIEELVLGPTLGQIILNKHPISSEDKEKWRNDLKEGLTYLHSMEPRPIFHGDVHPNNIIITPEKAAKLIDFSSIKSDLVKYPNRVQGIRDYLDPRVLTGYPYDGEADFYGLNKIFTK